MIEVCTECRKRIESDEERCNVERDERDNPHAPPRHKRCCVACHRRYGWPIDTNRWPHVREPF